MGSWGEGSGKRPLPAAQTKGRAGGHPELKGPPHPGDSHSLGEPPPPAPITGQRTAPLTQRLATPPHPQPAPSFPAALCLLGSASAADSAPRTAPAARGRALLAAEGGARGHAAAPQPPRPPPFRALLLLFLFCVSFLFSLKKTYPRASAPRQPLSPPPPPVVQAEGQPPPPGLRRRLGVPEGRRGEGGEAAGSGAGRVQAASPRRGLGEEDWGWGGSSSPSPPPPLGARPLPSPGARYLPSGPG